MPIDQEKGVQLINKYVATWTKKYLFHTTFIEEDKHSKLFMCEFSLPTPTKPVPIATVKNDNAEIDMTFRFQKDSLIHKPQRTIRLSKMQDFIETILKKKLLTRNSVFFLGTDFQRTRIKDPRLDSLLKVQIQVAQKQKTFMDSSLIADLKPLQTIHESKQQHDQLHKKVKQYFNNVDKQGVGVVTAQQFHTILKNLNLNLTKQERNQIIEKSDSNKNGVIQYKQYESLAFQIVRGIFQKNKAIQLLKQREEEFLLEAQLMLFNDPIHDSSQLILQQLKKLDEDQLGKLKVGDIRKVLQKFTELLNVAQLSDLIKLLTKKYGYNDVPIQNVHRQIQLLKLHNLKEFLFQNSLSILELYLRELLQKYDESKLGKLPVTSISKAFDQNVDRIKLNSVQKYVVRSILDCDEYEMVDYKSCTKVMAEVIKMFFTPMVRYVAG